MQLRRGLPWWCYFAHNPSVWRDVHRMHIGTVLHYVLRAILIGPEAQTPMKRSLQYTRLDECTQWGRWVQRFILRGI